MKLCDLTQFYSPLSGGVKRYVHEKIAYIQQHCPSDEHVLIIPGAKTERLEADRSRIYTIQAPLLSRTSRYRALLNLRAVEEILEDERPDLIESGDPYQMAWKAIASGEALGIPVVGFYHSHFPEAYLRSVAKFLGQTATKAIMDFARRYVRTLYNRFAATLVPSLPLAGLLHAWGVTNGQHIELGVNTQVFHPDRADLADTRATLGIARQRCLLLYVGRLAPEKNTVTLFRSFASLHQRYPDRFHLLVVGDGAQRESLMQLRERTGAVTWLPYCTDSAELARYYRAADLFVHPGVQETFGFVALESQACGTAVVGVSGSYMDQVIFHDQELWAQRNTPEALAEAIERTSAQDLEALGAEAARNAATRHAWPRVFSRLFSVYREVCARYRKA